MFLVALVFVVSVDQGHSDSSFVSSIDGLLCQTGAVYQLSRLFLLWFGWAMCERWYRFCGSWECFVGLSS